MGSSPDTTVSSTWRETRASPNWLAPPLASVGT